MKRLLFSLTFAVTACASSHPPAVHAATAANTVAVAAVDRETLAVEVALWERYQGLRAGCTDAACDEAAKQQARAALADRRALARAAIDAQRRAADLIEQAQRCPGGDDACVRSALTAAGAAEATAGAIVVQLRQARAAGGAP